MLTICSLLMSQPATQCTRVVLVVDDEDEIRSLTERMLGRLGYSALLAEDARAAESLLRAHADTVDCALIDLSLPGTSVADHAAALRAVVPGLPIAVMSGYDLEDAADRLGGFQPTEWLRKPFSMAALRRCIGTTCSV